MTLSLPSISKAIRPFVGTTNLLGWTEFFGAAFNAFSVKTVSVGEPVPANAVETNPASKEAAKKHFLNDIVLSLKE
ncbi:hypothetical protein VNKP15269_C54100 (plasmid) [Klebsiella pneumoniae]|nr:hypothetical protein VNKP15269_C54100 [Klebsiella pneumoniae]